MSRAMLHPSPVAEAKFKKRREKWYGEVLEIAYARKLTQPSDPAAYYTLWLMGFTPQDAVKYMHPAATFTGP